MGRADEHYLHVQGDGLRPQALGGEEAQALAHLLHHDLAVPDRPLEAIVGEEVAQDLLHRQHQIAAVGLVQRAAPDQREVGLEGAVHGLLLDAPEQVVVGGVPLHDHRRPRRFAVVHSHVHLVLAKGQLLHPGLRGRAGRLGLMRLTQEGVDVGDDVLLHLIEVAHHLGQLLVLLLQILNEAADHVQGHLAVQGLERPVGLLLPGARLLQRSLQLRLQGFPPPADGLANLGLQAEEFLLAEGAALHYGQHDPARRRGLDGEPLLLGPLVELGQQRLPLALEGLADGVAAGGVLVAFEGGGDLLPRPLDKRLHVLLKATADAGGQAQRARPIGVDEVVDVAPVAGSLFVLGHTLKEGVDGRHLAGARLPRHVDVEPHVADAQPEIQGLHRSLLPDDGVQPRQVGRAGETQAGRIADVAELGCGHFLRCRHVFSRRGTPRVGQRDNHLEKGWCQLVRPWRLTTQSVESRAKPV